MATKGFTKINNSIIFDLNLSCEALGLYTKLQYLSTIDNFSIHREHIKSISGYGETAFRRVWKELKDKGVLIETKATVKGRYEYVYTLKNSETVAKVVAPEEKKKPTPPVKKKRIDSDGNPVLDGQVFIDEVLEATEQQEVPVDKNIDAVAKTTGLTTPEIAELLKEANNDAAKVIECHKYTVAQDNVKDIFSYTKWAIKNNKTLKSKTDATKGIFNDYPQRVYDSKKLENALLYGDPYELPA